MVRATYRLSVVVQQARWLRARVAVVMMSIRLSIEKRHLTPKGPARRGASDRVERRVRAHCDYYLLQAVKEPYKRGDRDWQAHGTALDSCRGTGFTPLSEIGKNIGMLTRERLAHSC
jgi:hypothetical protein